MILYNNKEVIFGQFPNGEINLKKIKLDPQDINHVVTWKYEGDAELFKLLLVREALDAPATLRVTYFPYSRMDRASNTYLFSLQVVARLINSMSWEKVVIYEPHSDVLPALIDRVQVVDVTVHLLKSVGWTDYQVCFPDVGAFKRYADKVKTNEPLIGIKRRDFETGKILSLDIAGRAILEDVIILDDLCSKGGTFIMTAEKLRYMGYKNIGLVVAHCENTIFSGEVLTTQFIDEVLTTDSIPRKNAASNLVVVPIDNFKWN